MKTHLKKAYYNIIVRFRYQVEYIITILRFLRLTLLACLLKGNTFIFFLILSLPQTFDEELHDILVEINISN